MENLICTNELRVINIPWESHLVQESEGYSYLMVDGISHFAVFMVNFEGYIIVWNRGEKRLLKYTTDEIIGQHFSSLYAPDADEDSSINDLALAVKSRRFEKEQFMARNDGSCFFAEVAIMNIEQNEGLNGFIFMVWDISLPTLA